MSEADKLTRIKAELIVMAEYLGVTITDNQLRLYAQDLLPYGIDEVSLALEKIRKERVWKNFPLPAEILRYAPSYKGTPEEQADIIAGRIIKAVSHIGYDRPTKAREYLGELAWEVFESYGSPWREFCTSLYQRDVGNLRARLKNAGLTVIQRAERKNQKLQLENPEVRGRLAGLVNGITKGIEDKT